VAVKCGRVASRGRITNTEARTDADRCEQSSAFLSQEWCKTLRCRFEAGFLELKEQRAEEEKEEELVKREEGGPGHRGEGKRISEHEQEGLRGQPAACTKSPGDKIGEEANSSNVSSVRMSRRSSSQQPAARPFFSTRLLPGWGRWTEGEGTVHG
jgi:hypothetical protein